MIYKTAKVIITGNENIHINTIIGDFALILCKKFALGENSQINGHASIIGMGTCDIGKNSVISFGCILMTRSDSPGNKFMCDAQDENDRNIIDKLITIGDNCFIGANSVLMPGCYIADGSIIGALTYVPKNFKTIKNGIYFGNPIRLQEMRKYDSKK